MTSNYYVESNGLYQSVSFGVWLTYLWGYSFERIDNDYVVHLGSEYTDEYYLG